MRSTTPKAILIMGVSGCGKSTIGQMLSRETGIPFLDADHFHSEENIAKMANGEALTDEDRLPWLRTLSEQVQLHLNDHKSVILACSALKESYRNLLTEKAPQAFRIVFLKGTPEQVASRLAERSGHFMPSSLLKSQFDTLEEPVDALEIAISKSPEQISGEIKQDVFEKAEIGVMGMGVMGLSLARNLGSKGVSVALFNREIPGKEEEIAAKASKQYQELSTALPFNEITPFIEAMQPPRKILMMVPAGDATTGLLENLLTKLSPGDVIIDGGNSHFQDTAKRCQQAEDSGMYYLGCGISGGEKGALEGPSLMPGGHKTGWKLAAPLLRVMAAKDRSGVPCCSYIGPDGSGHLVKTIHNGIEYGEMQILAEAYHLLRSSGSENEEIGDVFSTWQEGELQSFLLDISAKIMAFKTDDTHLIDKILDRAGNKGTGNWASVSAIQAGYPSGMMSSALFARYLSFFKDRRTALSTVYPLGGTSFSVDKQDLKKAVKAARIINHIQGFEALSAIGKEHDLGLDLPEIARVWTQGCIIRSGLMEDLIKVLKEADDVMEHQWIRAQLSESIPALIRICTLAMHNGIAVPALTEALNFFNGITTAVSPANLIQAQRDFFGAHTYRRIDDPNGKSYHTKWE